MGFLGGESACNTGDVGLIPGLEDPQEESMATRSSTLAWKISMGKGAWWDYSQWDPKDLDMTEQLSRHVGTECAPGAGVQHMDPSCMGSSIQAEVLGLHGSKDSRFILTDVDTEQVV